MVSYSFIKTLSLYSDDLGMNTLIQESFSTTISQLLEDVKNKKQISKEVKTFVKRIFDEIITLNQPLTQKYQAITIPPDMLDNDIKSKLKQKRRIPKYDLLSKKDVNGLNENERMMLRGYQLKSICDRIHNAGKHNKLTDEEARTVIAAVDIVNKKVLPILNKYGRKKEKI